MKTPICDFVAAYENRRGIRLHMPGHKGVGAVECRDITEIAGADELYHARGIIRASEENAAALFGAARTVYATEGSSLCIRAMVYLALTQGRLKGKAPLILAGRNAHKAFLSAAALMDAQVEWLYGDSLIACPVDPEAVEKAIRDRQEAPAALFITSPDYLGHQADIGALAAVCHRHGMPLLVDNAHGAYLKFLDEDRHPMTLGADLCCDSAHKTLPVLTGGAYLHIGFGAPRDLADQAERAMALFASTSPSYLILQSLDQCNAYLAGDYPRRLQALGAATARMKEKLQGAGYTLAGQEALKITIAPKTYGYTGDQLHQRLRAGNIECEFSDPDFLTMMLTPETGEADRERLMAALLAVPKKPPILSAPPTPPKPESVLSIRRAMFSPLEELPVDRCLGRVLGDAHVACPPAVPILVSGERIDADALKCFRYYGVENCWVIREA